MVNCLAGRNIHEFVVFSEEISMSSSSIGTTGLPFSLTARYKIYGLARYDIGDCRAAISTMVAKLFGNCVSSSRLA